MVAHEKMHERNYMKAVVVENYDSIDGISIKEMDLPDLAKGEVRVRIGAAAVGAAILAARRDKTSEPTAPTITFGGSAVGAPAGQ